MSAPEGPSPRRYVILRTPVRAPEEKAPVSGCGSRKPVVSVDPAKIPTSISGPNAGASVDADLWASMMPGPISAPRTVGGSFTVRGVGFNDAPPDFEVSSVAVYEKDSGRLVARIPQPELQHEGLFGRGEQRSTYRLEFPLSSVDLSKQYTVVAETSINGAPAKSVRSEFGTIQQAF